VTGVTDRRGDRIGHMSLVGRFGYWVAQTFSKCLTHYFMKIVANNIFHYFHVVGGS